MISDYIFEIQKEQQVGLPTDTVVFLHYCIIRGIKFIIEQAEWWGKDIDVDGIRSSMSRQIAALEMFKKTIEPVEVEKELTPLIEFVVGSKGLKFKDETARNYMNSITDAGIRLLLREAARIARQQNRGEVSPTDVDDSSKGIFGKGIIWW